MNLSPEEKEIGRENYYEVIGVSRRDFMKRVVAAGAVSGGGLGAMYFNYGKVADPVRVGVIGTGDEGNVLIGALNPEYVQVVAIADIRPYNVHRAFHGDWSSDAAIAARPGLLSKYGWKSRQQAEKQVKVYTDDYHELLQNDDVEAVIIALPLHLHARVAVEAMLAGKHVLTEKLMAHNVAQCKVMGRVAEERGLHLATGHQRHYSILYDNAVNLIRWGVLGEIHHIRAQWHRGNLPGRDSWQQPLPGGEVPHGGEAKDRIDRIADTLRSLEGRVKKEKDPKKLFLYEKRLAQWKAWDSDQKVQADRYGYEQRDLGNGWNRSALEELCRWRLWERTGGGLMAELGSHQLDAASIFISALRRDKKKSHPLTVHAVGGRHVFPADREAEDHVYCAFEFPGPGYDPSFDVGYRDAVTQMPGAGGIPAWDKDENKKIVVTYSSIMGNGYGGYGEVVMGTKGTLILEREKEVMLYGGSSTTTKVGVKNDAGGPTLDTQASGDAAPVARAAESTGPISRGYAEEIEHWAYCVRENPGNKLKEDQVVPKCQPKVALGDAVIALTANVAIKNANNNKGGFLQFQESWYDIDNDETPDGSDLKAEMAALTKPS
ncbi:MAG: Gfo/Idh/MocA family oxidoreductase [Planctomycetaceae bacterium]|jgi:predicted dehydrogenase|nr:Gfo/Idh/MocA family oxidoreductase [Planctomycetaceae bacterium]